MESTFNELGEITTLHIVSDIHRLEDKMMLDQGLLQQKVFVIHKPMQKLSSAIIMMGNHVSLNI
jgi:hypothetical protein